MCAVPSASRRRLCDRVDVAGLRRREHLVTGRAALARDVDLAVAATDLQTGRVAVEAVADGRALGVVLLGREARLDLRDEVARIRLRRGILALLLLTEEGRQGDRGENADDQHDNEELDEREALLLGPH